MRVKNQCLQRTVNFSFRCWNIFNNCLQQVFNPKSSFSRNKNCLISRQSYNIFNFQFNFIRICRWQIDLINYRQYFQIIFQCQIHICQCLRLYPLSSINYKQGPITSCKRSRYFVNKVNVPWSIN